MPSPEARRAEAAITAAIDDITPLVTGYQPGDDPRATAAAIMQVLTGDGWRHTNAIAPAWVPPPRPATPAPVDDTSGQPLGKDDALRIAREHQAANAPRWRGQQQ